MDRIDEPHPGAPLAEDDRLCAGAAREVPDTAQQVAVRDPGADHHHVAEEIYVPLTGGTEWRMGEGGFRKREAGQVVHHASNVNHAMRTGNEPLLALYIWRGGPLAQKSTITGTATQGRS